MLSGFPLSTRNTHEGFDESDRECTAAALRSRSGSPGSSIAARDGRRRLRIERIECIELGGGSNVDVQSARELCVVHRQLVGLIRFMNQRAFSARGNRQKKNQSEKINSQHEISLSSKRDRFIRERDFLVARGAPTPQVVFVAAYTPARD